MKRNSIFYLIVFAFASCVVEEPDLSRYTISPIENVEEARDVEVTYTDSSRLVFILKAPLSRRQIEKFSTEEIFPEGIDVTFYDRYGTPRSWLKADYAIRDQVSRTIIVQKNVILENDQGERLEAPELIWDEKTKEIYTDRFVKHTREDRVIYSYGFKSNESFTHYELHAVSGSMVKEE
ncbi:MAG TPA: LPS export ABC transporter periplasmic protein LptC [Saprospiraceae bacterium]|nr:LPS export ABC transporter periplasmic protein LptC [Saprospiraceae bacterium]